MAEDQKQKEQVIFVNKQQFKVAEDKLSGEQILQLANLSVADYDLYLVHGQSSQKIEAGQIVDIKNGLHFNAIIRSAPYG